MIYPNNFEQKIGFDEIRALLKKQCLSTLGKEMVDEISFSDNAETVNEWLLQVKEFRRMQEDTDSFPMQYFFDVRESVTRLRLEGTHMEESELFDLRRSMETICSIVRILSESEDSAFKYPALNRLTENVVTFPELIRHIDRILDRFGHMRDDASPALAETRRELSRTEGSISRTLYSILRSAQSEGLVEKDVTPAFRDGRLVIPVAPALKRKIRGIVHDESATGKTIFIEPAEVVEANNRIRELEAEERREVIRILKEFAKQVRPHVHDILNSYHFLAQIDLIHAKAELADRTKAVEPHVETFPHIDWIHAIHPLLRLSLDKQGKQVVPLDIMLTRERFILIISGPNAGGKSVCLKTVGLLQYMIQCGLPVPLGDRSRVGIFESIMIDIGDEQSIENDLSTYSSHLTNMKQMMRNSNERTLLLIDEFGGGTEPQIGGAIAEAVLKQFCQRKVFGVITTHYQNLKHFADSHDNVVNGAMLYDRHNMQALFQLAIGQPGSSFAIEIARKTGIPEEVIRDASEIVGSEYIQSDKYLQDIVRDKRYWEGKRQTIRQREKHMEETIERYQTEIEDLQKSRKEILRKAKEEVEQLMQEANARIENTIRSIKEAQAEKEKTRQARQELTNFRESMEALANKELEEKIARKMEKLKEKQNRKKEKKAGKGKENGLSAQALAEQQARKEAERLAAITPGCNVRIKGQTSVGEVMEVNGKNAVIAFGSIKTTVKLDRLERTNAQPKQADVSTKSTFISAQTQDSMYEKKLHFKQDIDVRGMRGDEALQAVTYFIDDAILVGMSRVRILHGTGTGILRMLIRQYLETVPGVRHFADEHIQFGGAGITVVDLS